MTDARARVFEYHVETDREWTARSDLGGPALAREAEWTPEHLVLAGLSQCTLTSLKFHKSDSWGCEKQLANPPGN